MKIIAIETLVRREIMVCGLAVFERRGSVSGAPYGAEDSPLAIQQVALCAESRRLCTALPHGHVVLFKFRKQDTQAETHVSTRSLPPWVHPGIWAQYSLCIFLIPIFFVITR